ncbi:hypothetical protein [uncultured Williamsia sp.]|uniref:hypothetical protein n=1 Tax=uncultured Williamsia sp. TaxID=259311 RepID=UPI00262E1800|nr:hypothetical protein [uncultured Williamsia sp.]
MTERRVSIPVGLAAGVASAVAGLFLAAPSRTGDIVGLSAQPPGFPWGSTTTASAWGLLAALAMCVGARRVADAVFAGAVAAVVLLVVGISSSPPTLLTAVAAGVLLGAALQLSRTVSGHSALVAATAGVVAGVLLAPMLARLRAGLPSGNRRYADYLPGDSALLVGDSTVVEVGAVSLAVLAVAVLAALCLRGWRDPIGGTSRVVVLTSAGMVVGCVLTQWWFLRFLSSSLRDESSTGLHTFYGGYVVVGMTLVAALVHRETTGLMWVAAAAATVAVSVDGTTASGIDLAAVTALLVVVAAVATTVVTRRDALPRKTRGVPIAVAVLGVFTATQFLSGDLSAAVPALVGPFGVPVAVTIALTAAVMANHPEPSAVVGAVALLTLLRLTTGSDFGWTSYTPLTDASGFDGLTATPPSAARTAVGFIAIATCFVVAVVLARRRRADPSVT